MTEDEPRQPATEPPPNPTPPADVPRTAPVAAPAVPPAQAAWPPPPPGWPPPNWQAYYQPPPRPRNRFATLWLVLALVVLGYLLMTMIGMVGLVTGRSAPMTRDHIGVISVTGVIRDGGRGGLFVGPGARGITEDIRRARKDDRVKAVIILIDSPGGSPAASHAIYEEIIRLREKKKVIACMTDVAASGGYYVASACDRIMAQGSTMTGSIGVIFGGVGYYGLMEKLGLVDQTQTAGKYKDIGSGMRPMTADEKAFLQALLQDVYSQFINAVATGRKMDPIKVRRLAEGKIYTGAQAQKVGLVDDLGSFWDAVAMAGKLGGLQGEPPIKYYGETGGLLGGLAGSESMFRRGLGQSHLQEPSLEGPMLLLPDVYSGLYLPRQ